MGRQLDDLSGREIGIYKVLKLHHMHYKGENKAHGESYYLCECKNCGKQLLVARSQLIQRKNKFHWGECI